jgi:hypothetical protein
MLIFLSNTYIKKILNKKYVLDKKIYLPIVFFFIKFYYLILKIYEKKHYRKRKFK